MLAWTGVGFQGRVFESHRDDSTTLFTPSTLVLGVESPVARYQAGTAFKRLLHFIQTHKP